MSTLFQAQPCSINSLGAFFIGKDHQFPNSTGVRRVLRGENVFQPTDKADSIYFIKEGKVKISALNSEQKEVTKAIYSSGDLFGEQAILDQEFRRDWAVALQNTTLQVLSAVEMLSMLNGRTDLTMLLMQLIVTRQQDMEHRLESLVFRDSRSRVVECLVKLTAQKGQQVGFEWVLRNPITHQEIANLTATSRQTVTTTLNDLRYARILTFNRKRLLVRDLEKLKAEIKS